MGWGVWESREKPFSGYKPSVWSDENVLEMEGGDSCTQHGTVLNGTECTLKTVVTKIIKSHTHTHTGNHFLKSCVYV